MISLALTWSPFLWHVEYFRNPGLQYYQMILVALPLSVVLSFIYLLLRRGGL